MDVEDSTVSCRPLSIIGIIKPCGRYNCLTNSYRLNRFTHGIMDVEHEQNAFLYWYNKVAFHISTAPSRYFTNLQDQMHSLTKQELLSSSPIFWIIRAYNAWKWALLYGTLAQSMLLIFCNLFFMLSYRSDSPKPNPFNILRSVINIISMGLSVLKYALCVIISLTLPFGSHIYLS